jgi:hypothetical protein
MRIQAAVTPSGRWGRSSKESTRRFTRRSSAGRRQRTITPASRIRRLALASGRRIAEARAAGTFGWVRCHEVSCTFERSAPPAIFSWGCDGYPSLPAAQREERLCNNNSTRGGLSPRPVSTCGRPSGRPLSLFMKPAAQKGAYWSNLLLSYTHTPTRGIRARGDWGR